jgi:hypothetical protein
METENVLKRAYAHWLKDGIFEIGLGILFAGVGAFRASIHFAGENSPTYYWLTAGLLLFMLGYGFGVSWIGKFFKARITYPRTGYITFKRPTYNFKSILALFIFSGLLGGLLGILSTLPNEQKIGVFVPIAQGVVGAIVFAYAAQRIEVKRLNYLAAISVGIGLVIGVLGVGVVLGLSFFYLSIGLTMILTGCLALVQYLRSHDPVDLNGESQ